MEALIERVEAVLTEVMPLLKVDGGGVVFDRIDGDTLYLRLTGNCVGCPGADITLRYGIESAVTSAIPEIKHVVAVEEGL